MQRTAFNADVDCLTEQLALSMPDVADMDAACTRLRAGVARPPTPTQRRGLVRLAAGLVAAAGDRAAPVLAFLAEVLPATPRPWPLLAPLLGAEDVRIADWAVEQFLTLAEQGVLPCDRTLLSVLAPLLDGTAERTVGPEPAVRLRNLLASRGADDLDVLFLRERDPAVRRLAARLLDLDERPPSDALAAQVLGRPAWETLKPLLTYTRAGHLDLMAFCGGRPAARSVTTSFRNALSEHGEDLVRRVVAELGWRRVSRGLRIEAYRELHWPGVAPLLVRPGEAALFDVPTPPARGRGVLLVTARGGCPVRRTRPTGVSDPVERFRRLNILHAELLSEILETVPAERRKIARVVELMDRVVGMFHDLFAASRPEYAILPDVWRDLRERTLAVLDGTPVASPLPADLTRLVLAFEDPANLGAVRTVHGLKRLLHQHGLKLGFQLVDVGRSPDQTVDLLLVPESGASVPGPSLRFVEFEAAAETDPDPWLPHPVRLAVDGLARQLLHGTQQFPGLDVFIFGNEVQYYVTFRNHPVFLRVDFSPPQRGGMLDLEYFGVSNYETDVHPARGLEAIRGFYRALGMDVRLEGTRLYVRYDKERCHDLADLLDKVAGLMRLVPFLMDVDWVIGSLQLPPRLKARVAEAWADRFARSGLFPVDAVLNANRTHVVMERVAGPTGEEETYWSGEGPYRDRWSGAAPAGLWEHLAAELARLGLPEPPGEVVRRTGAPALLDIERHVLEPIRRGLDAGRLVLRDGRPEPADTVRGRAVHAADHFARLLDGGGARLDAAVAMARPLADLEKFLPYRTIGAVGGLRVDRARLTLHGGELTVFAGRDEHGAIRLGTAVADDGLHRGSARRVAAADAARMWTLLRSANYVGDTPVGGDADPAATVLALKALAARRTPALVAGPGGDETVLGGLPAAPGRAVGRVLFGTAGRRPEDLSGRLLVAREIRPEDGPFLSRAVGILSTGGAVLSHAALLAIQFGKPAMVVEARWLEDAVPSLQFPVTRFRLDRSTVCGLDVCRRTVIASESGRLCEGDLCILDADEGVLQILGQDAETITLWQGFRQLVGAHAARELAAEPRRILEIRSDQLRARHQIKKALLALDDPAVARYALEEIVIGEALAKLPVFERAQILGELMSNATVAGKMRPWLDEITRRLADRFRGAARQYLELAPTARTEFEALGWRLRSLQRLDTLRMAVDLQRHCGIDDPLDITADAHPGDEPAVLRLRELRTALRRRLAKDGPHVRHCLRRLGRLREVLPDPPRTTRSVAAEAEQARSDARARIRLFEEPVLLPGDCGLETSALLGWKGANLAEIDRLIGADVVPPWYAVSDAALRRLLEQPLTPGPSVAEHLGDGARTLNGAINAVLALERADHAAKARLVRSLWDTVRIPDDLIAAITRAHRGLQGDDDGEPFVALRSSSCDEDSETSMQAGVYDTFLYVTGLPSVLEHPRPRRPRFRRRRRPHAARRRARAAHGRCARVGRAADRQRRQRRPARDGDQRGPGPGRRHRVGPRGRRPRHRREGPGTGPRPGPLQLPDQRQAAAGGLRPAPRRRHPPRGDALPPAAATGPRVHGTQRDRPQGPRAGGRLRISARHRVRPGGAPPVAAAGPPDHRDPRRTRDDASPLSPVRSRPEPPADWSLM
jgi:phosphohistidine swiveling domain-containing protein